MLRTFLLCTCLLLASGLVSATNLAVCGTGFTSNTCASQVTPGNADGNWTLESDPSATGECTTPCGGQVSTPASPFVTDTGQFPFPNWLADTSTSEWISPHANESADSDPYSTTVPYVYTETFTISGALNPGTTIIIGQWSADNYGNIYVNGAQVTAGANGAIPNNTGEFASFTAFTLNSSNASFHTGSNTLTFEVYNNANGTPDVTGLNVVITSATATSAPEPASFGLMGLSLVALGLIRRTVRPYNAPADPVRGNHTLPML